MGTAEMREIAGIIKLVLSHTSPATTKEGKKSLAKYELRDEIAHEANRRVQTLLGKYPLYPQLDLEMLLASIGEDASPTR
jgi:glycine hydroxymethyltransferase